jgi:8-oxo-dGTP diphosphatase
VDFTDDDTRLAAYAVIVDGRRQMLLALWNQCTPPGWRLPRGGVALHETVEEAAVPVQFDARVTGGELTHEVRGTTDEARWVPLDEIPDLPTSGSSTPPSPWSATDKPPTRHQSSHFRGVSAGK